MKLQNTRTTSVSVEPQDDRFFWVPADLRLHDALPPRMWRYIDGARMLLHVVTTKTWTLPWGAWVPISHREAAAIVGDHRAWNALRAVLISGGILECEDTCAPGKPYRYRLSSRWHSGGFRRVRPRNPRSIDLFVARA